MNDLKNKIVQAISVILGLVMAIFAGIYGLDVLFSSITILTNVSGDAATVIGLLSVLLAVFKIVTEVSWILDTMLNR